MTQPRLHVSGPGELHIEVKNLGATTVLVGDPDFPAALAVEPGESAVYTFDYDAHLRATVSAATGVPVHLLVGDTEAELKDYAAKLVAFAASRR